MKWVVSALIIVLSAVSAPAATIYIDANGTGDYPTIQAAIDDANDGDEIVLADGSYRGNGTGTLIFLAKP